MNATEERLVAALHARAELVTPESLTPASPPSAARSVARPGLWLAAAAAVLAAVGTGVVVQQSLDDDQRPQPAREVLPEGGLRADLDGDGADDRAVVEDGLLRVNLAADPGATVEAEVHRRAELMGAADVDANTLGLAVSTREAQLSGRPVEVWRVVDGALQRSRPADGGFYMSDEFSRVYLADGDLLISEWTGTPPREGLTRRVQTSRLVLDDQGNLTAVETDPWCMVGLADPRPCAAGVASLGSTKGLPLMLPEADDPTYAVGEPSTWEMTDQGTAVLEKRGNRIVLVSSTSDGSSQEARVPAALGTSPTLSDAVRFPGDAPFFLVAGETGDATEMAVFSYLNGTLSQLTTEGFLGSGFTGNDRVRTWVSQEGDLFTATRALDSTSPEHTVVQWELGETGLVQKPLGTVCLDFDLGEYGDCSAG